MLCFVVVGARVSVGRFRTDSLKKRFLIGGAESESTDLLVGCQGRLHSHGYVFGLVVTGKFVDHLD